MEAYATDIGNAYLEAKTLEKVCIRAGAEFGELQWLITLGRFDIQTAVMTMSSFRAQPRFGHLDRLKRIYAYIHKFENFKIRFQVEEPDLSYLDNSTQ